jgi:hypothetical protein
MELSMSGGALRTFTRCVTCLARVGSDLVLQAHPAKVVAAAACLPLRRGFLLHSPAASCSDIFFGGDLVSPFSA